MNLSDMQHRQPLIFSDQLPETSPDLAMISPGGLRSMRLTSAGSEPSMNAMNAWFGGRRTSDLIQCPAITAWKGGRMGRSILHFDRIDIQNKKSDTDHSDNDWLSIAWMVDHRDGSQPVSVQQTVSLLNQDGSPILDSGNIIQVVEQSVPCLDGDLVTAVYTITNLGSLNWDDQAKAASQVTQQVAKAVADIYLQVAQVVLEYLPFFGANPAAVAVGDVLAQALDKLHGPLLDLLDKTFESVITPLVGDIANELSNLLGHPNCSGEVMHDVAVFVPTTEEFKKNSFSRSYQGPQSNSSCGEPPHTLIDWTTDRDLDVFIGTFGTTPPNYRPLWLYLVSDNGDLMWYRQDTSSSNWQGPTKVGNGWQGFQQIVPAGGNSLYGIPPDGILKWYRHDGFNDGSPAWHGPVDVGTGWQNFHRVFSGSDGVLYAIQPDGSLLWYSNSGFAQGGTAWQGPMTVGSGWAEFRHVFSMGQGIIYAIQPDGTLLWYRHRGFATGATSWSGPYVVGSAWNMFRDVLPVGDGIVVAVKPDGDLFWYKHTDFETGVSPSKSGNSGITLSAHWEGPSQIGNGWQGYWALFALLPATPVGPA
jgi:hypothetical protein